MKLEPEQESMAAGESGRAVSLAMKTLVAYGKGFGAKRLVPVASGHLAGSFGIRSFEAYFRILDRMASEGARVKVKTTVNPRPGRGRNLINRALFGKQSRLERGLAAIGVTPNYSCVCYEEANIPSFGDRLAWAESSAVQYANSVLGARTNRNSIVIDMCSAVTGYTPEFGYLLDENRRGSVLVKLDIQRMDASALGFLLGREVVNRVPVIEHRDFSRIELKNMGGAMAASGAVALFHVEGLTPEAPDLQAAFQGSVPETITVTQKDIDSLRSARPEEAGLVVFGCPQMTFDEAMALAERFGSRPVRKPVWFCMEPQAMARFSKTKQHERVRSAGVEVNDCCPLAALTVRIGRQAVLTSSGKLYYYLDGAEYGNEEDCLRACGAAT